MQVKHTLGTNNKAYQTPTYKDYNNIAYIYIYIYMFIYQRHCQVPVQEIKHTQNY